MVDDPSSRPDLYPTEEEQAAERQKLFRLIERLVKWDNSNNSDVLAEARSSIQQSLGKRQPVIRDPFCGGGSIPVEAQRLGLTVEASDLNPVAAMITKALVELPYRFARQAPVNPGDRERISAGGDWRGLTGVARDIRYYGAWVRVAAKQRLDQFYPRAILSSGGDATVVAWLWARRITCPNPGCRTRMPLVRSWAICTKRGAEAHVVPLINEGDRVVRFDVRPGLPTMDSPKMGRGARFRCIVCGNVADESYVKQESSAGRMDAN